MDEKDVKDTGNTKPVDSTNGQSDVDKLAKTVSDLTALVEKAVSRANSDGPRSEDKEAIDKANAEIESLQKKVDTFLNSRQSRKGEFEVDERSITTYSPAHLKALIKTKAVRNSDAEEIQRGNDELYLASTMLGVEDPRKSEYLMTYTKANYPALYKAMQTAGSGTGAEWIPTGFSSSMIEDVRMQLRVAALHQRFNMPTNPFTYPVEGADIDAYLVSENTGDNDAGDTTTWVPAATPGTANLTFSAKKIGVRSVVSTEMTEDAIVAALPYVRGKIITALAEAQENMVINGDTRTSYTTNLSGTTLASNNQALAWYGYRRCAELAGTTVDGAGAISLGDIRAVRSKMGKYGVSPSNLSIVCGINTYNQLLSLDQVITIDKYGPNATILSGELGRLDGMPIIVSEFIPENTGASGRGTGAYTTLLLVRRDLYWFGDRRDITLKGREVIETDQQVLVALQRLDFKPILDPARSSAFKVSGALVGLTLG